jgi:hypothetical protein
MGKKFGINFLAPGEKVFLILGNELNLYINLGIIDIFKVVNHPI